jgi:hypothetical protein
MFTAQTAFYVKKNCQNWKIPIKIQLPARWNKENAWLTYLLGEDIFLGTKFRQTGTVCLYLH